MQIAKLVMQIHANYVLIIDSKKNQIFLMGGASVTHVPTRLPTFRAQSRYIVQTITNIIYCLLLLQTLFVEDYFSKNMFIKMFVLYNLLLLRRD
jgi:hypothetical protein